MLENPGLGDGEVGATTSPYRVSHVFAGGVRARYECGDLVVNEQMLDMLDGKPDRLDALLERRRQRPARRRAA
jgi:hypothetical protein